MNPIANPGVNPNVNSSANPEIALRDIHLPDPVSWWPPAIGWWLLLALLILLPIIIWAMRKLKARQALRKQALAELSSIETNFDQHQNSQQLVSELSILLRRICISRFPRHDVAGLNGEAWTDFLNSQANSFDAETSQALISGPFQKQCDISSQTLISACRHWIEQLQSNKGTQP